MINLHEMTFFQNFPKDIVSELQQWSEVVHFQQQDIIIHQGEAKPDLYFLLGGLLNIYSNGELTGQLRSRGDMVGELGFISNEASKVTIKADSKVDLLKVNGKVVHQLIESSAESINIYKIYTGILLKKLETLNQQLQKKETLIKELEDSREYLEALKASPQLKKP